MSNTITTIRIGDCRIEAINLYNLLNITNQQAEVKHNHSFYEMHFIKKGISKLMINDIVYETDENNIIVIPKEAYHYALSNEANFQFSAFNFDIVKEKQSGKTKKQEYAYFMSVFDVKTPIVVPMCDKLSQLYDEIIKFQRKHDIYSVNKLHVKVIEFFLEFVNMISKKRINKDEEFKKSKYGEDAIRKQRIEQLLAVENGYKLEDFAREIYLSPRQFERFVYRVYGKSYKELVLESRMLRGRQMIQEGKYSLVKIASLLGYTSYGGFLSAYKKFYGVNPTDEILGKKE